MRHPSYPHREIETRWREKWSPAGSGGADSERVGESPQAPFPVPAAPAGGAMIAEGEVKDFRGEKAAAPHRAKGQKHYVYPTPLSPAFKAGVLTELRRFVVADIYARLQRHLGNNVRFPLGITYWSEDLLEKALDENSHPFEYGEREWERFRGNLEALRISLDQQGAVEDRDPNYFRWTQWIFQQFLRRGLVSLRVPGAGGCAAPEIGPAGGPSAREAAGRKPEALWMLSLAPYGDRLMNDLGKSNWPVEERTAQRHRIGRQRGCDVIFQVSNPFRMEYTELGVFTTRVETIYGVTFILLHPWHPALEDILDPGYEEDVRLYRDRILQDIEPKLSAVRTGGFALNPANLQKVPVLVSRLAMEPDSRDAILGVPAHDPLLFELARRVRLPIREVIRGAGSKYDVRGVLKEPFTGEGDLTNSGTFSGLPQRVGRDRIISFLGRRGICRRTTQFLLDSIPVSKASLWGVPVPLIHCPACGVVPVPERELPVLPPPVSAHQLQDARKKGSWADPGLLKKFQAAACPRCRGEARRDSQVIAPWLGECWMLLRHPIPELGGPVEGMSGNAAPAEPAGQETAALEKPASEPDREVKKSIPIEALDELALFGNDPLAESPAAPAAEENSPSDPGAGEKPAVPPPESSPAPAPAEELLGLPGGEATADSGAGDRSMRASVPAYTAAPGGGSGSDEEKAAGEPAAGKDAAADSEESSLEGAAAADGPAAAAALNVPMDEGEEITASTVEDGEDEDEDEEDLDEAEEIEDAAGKLFPEPTVFQPFRQAAIQTWLPVDLAFGRVGRGVMDILRDRFITKFLYDLREISFYEPFYRFHRSGPVAVASPEGKGCDVSISELIEINGADALRFYLMSHCGAVRRLKFSEHGLHHAHRFLGKIWDHIRMRLEKGKFVSRRILVAKHQLIHEVTQGIRRLRLHSAVSAFHRFFKVLEDPTTTDEEMDRGSIRTFLILLFPFTPHLASELWTIAEGEGSLESQAWPEASSELLHPPEIEVVVKVNNRFHCLLAVPSGLEKEKLQKTVLGNDRILEFLAGRTPARVFAVPDRIVNILLEESAKDQPAASS